MAPRFRSQKSRLWTRPAVIRISDNPLTTKVPTKSESTTCRPWLYCHSGIIQFESFKKSLKVLFVLDFCILAAAVLQLFFCPLLPLLFTQKLKRFSKTPLSPSTFCNRHCCARTFEHAWKRTLCCSRPCLDFFQLLCWSRPPTSR